MASISLSKSKPSKRSAMAEKRFQEALAKHGGDLASLIAEAREAALAEAACTDSVRFVVPSRPVPKQSTRIGRNRWTGAVQTYTDDKIEAFERLVGLIARKAFTDGGFKPIPKGVPVRMEITACTSVKPHCGPNLCTPDTEQIEKPIKDALQKAGLIFNDSQVWGSHPVKIRADFDGILVDLAWQEKSLSFF